MGPTKRENHGKSSFSKSASRFLTGKQPEVTSLCRFRELDGPICEHMEAQRTR